MSERFPSFEAYLEEQYGGWAKAGQCGACMRKADRLTAGVMRSGHRMAEGDCEACVRYRYGYDQAEATAVRALIYGAVREALKQEIPFSLLRGAMDEALIDDRDEEVEKQMRRRIEAEAS